MTLRLLTLCCPLLSLVACPSDKDPETGVSTSGAATTMASASGTGATSGENNSSATLTGSGSTSSDDETSGSTAASPDNVVVMETTLGEIQIELDLDRAPITTTNFLAYVDGGFYDGSDGAGATIFHRVLPGFVVQGGGLTVDMATKGTMPAIVNESSNGLQNVRGTLSMARTNDPNSATSQFFINVVDNPSLDEGDGYAVFGRVIEGMDIVDAIVAVPTGSNMGFDDVPVDPIVIMSATRL